VDNLFLLKLAQTYSAHTGKSIATLGHYSTGDARIFVRFMEGGDCSTQRARRIGQWFADNWPEDLEWPRAPIWPHPSRRAAA
jgi:hypothetical protein